MSIYGIGFGTVAAPVARLAFNSTSGGKGVVNAVYSSSMLLISSGVTMIISAIGSEDLSVLAVIVTLMLIMSFVGVNWKESFAVK